MVKKIYGQGSPLLDLMSDVGEDMLKKYDLQPANACLAEEKHIPLYAELAARPDIQYVPGGATLNSIRVANWMLQKKAPGSASYTGCIGTDSFGTIMREKAEAEGLNVPFQVTEDKPTGTCGVLVVGKERSLVANLSAAEKFQTAHLETEAVATAIKEAEVFYIAGFFLTVSPDAVLAIAKHCHENGKIFCFNLSAPFLIEFFGDKMAAVLPYVDYLFANENEAEKYGEVNSCGKTVAEVAEALQKFDKTNDARPRTVVFTQGSDATVVATKDGTQTFDVPAVPADKIVDTNGAGDSFVGGFLSGLAQDASLQRCVEAGHYAAGQIIQASGCTLPADLTFE